VTKLYPFQKEGVRQIYHFGGRALLADEMGLGKTIQALEWIRRIPKRRPVVIVTPASLKWTWQVEAATHFGMRAEVLEGHCRPRSYLPGSIVVINYEILASWLPVLLREKPQCVIIDEVHFIKNPRAKRTKACFKLVHRAASVLGLSGTPITNRPIEFWSILFAIRPDLFPSYSQFAWRYTKPRHRHWGWTFNGARKMGELHRILRAECMIRRLKEEVLPELGDKIRKIVAFRLPSYDEYNLAEDEFLTWLHSIDPRRAKRASKAQAMVKVGYLLRLVARLKLEQTSKWIADFFEANPDEKLVAFTGNTFVIDYFHAAFPSSVVVDGRVTGRKRVESVRKFQSNRSVNLFLGNWKAAGVGITLTTAKHAVALDYPWTPGDLLQGEDRIHRIGQKRKATVHYLMTLDTIEAKLVKVLREKATVLDAVLNGKRSGSDLDIFSQLLKSV
jgi:SWI/SNF-related matrix-associated actin-dependent regulator 1 of chromatin subfamily A